LPAALYGSNLLQCCAVCGSNTCMCYQRHAATTHAVTPAVHTGCSFCQAHAGNARLYTWDPAHVCHVIHTPLPLVAACYHRLPGPSAH
jgi:hypothetical protein